MTQDEIRLELLKLTYTHGRDAAEAVGRAKILEAFIRGEYVDEPEAPQKRGPGRPRKTDREPPLFG
jgi:hypothetical protein